MAGPTESEEVASITIRNVDEGLKSALRAQAVRHGKSMADEACDILRAALGHEASPANNLATAINVLFKPLGGFEMPNIPREPIREPLRFEG